MFWFTAEINFLYIVKMCTAEISFGLLLISVYCQNVYSVYFYCQFSFQFTAEISFLYIVSSVLVGVKM
jgi:hypothetical protein